MLMTKKRFRFDNKYLYGSAAFVVGFAGIIAYLAHFAPMRVPNTNVATTTPILPDVMQTEVTQGQKPAEQANDAAQNSTQAQPFTVAPSSTAPVQQATPAQSEPTVEPAAPEVTEPEVPTPAAPTEPEPVPEEESPESVGSVLQELPVFGPLLFDPEE